MAEIGIEVGGEGDEEEAETNELSEKKNAVVEEKSTSAFEEVGGEAEEGDAGIGLFARMKNSEEDNNSNWLASAFITVADKTDRRRE